MERTPRWDMKGSVNLTALTPKVLRVTVRVCARQLALADAGSGDRHALGEDLGGDEISRTPLPASPSTTPTP